MNAEHLRTRLEEARRRNDADRATARTPEELAFVAGQTLILNKMEGLLAIRGEQQTTPPTKSDKQKAHRSRRIETLPIIVCLSDDKVLCDAVFQSYLDTLLPKEFLAKFRRKKNPDNITSSSEK